MMKTVTFDELELATVRSAMRFFEAHLACLAPNTVEDVSIFVDDNLGTLTCEEISDFVRDKLT